MLSAEFVANLLSYFWGHHLSQDIQAAVSAQLLGVVQRYLSERFPNTRHLNLEGEELSSLFTDLEELCYYQLSLLRPQLSAVEWMFYLRSFPSQHVGDIRAAVGLCESFMCISRSGLYKRPVGCPSQFSLNVREARLVLTAVVWSSFLFDIRHERISSYFSGKCTFILDNDPKAEVFVPTYRDDRFVRMSQRHRGGVGLLSAFGHYSPVRNSVYNSNLLSVSPVRINPREREFWPGVPGTQLRASDMNYQPLFWNDEELLRNVPRSKDDFLKSTFSPEILSCLWICWSLYSKFFRSKSDFSTSILTLGGVLIPLDFVYRQFDVESMANALRIDYLGLGEIMSNYAIDHICVAANMKVDYKLSAPVAPVIISDDWVWIDASAVSRRLFRTAVPGQSGAPANSRAKVFEKGIQEVIDATKWCPVGIWRELISKKIKDNTGNIITDIDAVACLGNCVVLLDCKSVLPRVGVKGLPYMSIRSMADRLHEVCRDWQNKIPRLRSALLRYNVAYSNANIVGAVVVPELAYTDSEDVLVKILPGLPALLSPEELKFFLEQ